MWTTLQVHGGYGRHVYYLSHHQILETTKWTTVFQVQNAIGVYFVKVSVCWFILRMIAGTHEAIRRALLGTITLLTLLMLGNVFVICFQCVPFEAVWNPAISGRCMAASDVVKSTKTFNCRCFPSLRLKAAHHGFSLWRRSGLYLCHTINPGLTWTANEYIYKDWTDDPNGTGDLVRTKTPLWFMR